MVTSLRVKITPVQAPAFMTVRCRRQRVLLSDRGGSPASLWKAMHRRGSRHNDALGFSRAVTSCADRSLDFEAVQLATFAERPQDEEIKSSRRNLASAH